jgi:hypothetical protein
MTPTPPGSGVIGVERTHLLERRATDPGSDSSGMDGKPMSDRVYEVRVAGLVPKQDLLRDFGDVTIVAHEVRTVVSGTFADQAALHGFLSRLRAYGLEVVEIRRVVGTGDPRGLPEGAS